MKLARAITTYVDQLSPAAEERILVGRLRVRLTWDPITKSGCLIGLGENYQAMYQDQATFLDCLRRQRPSVQCMLVSAALAFDAAADGGGRLEVVGAAIRQRILDNQARRIMSKRQEGAHDLGLEAGSSVAVPESADTPQLREAEEGTAEARPWDVLLQWEPDQAGAEAVEGPVERAMALAG